MPNAEIVFFFLRKRDVSRIESNKIYCISTAYYSSCLALNYYFSPKRHGSHTHNHPDSHRRSTILINCCTTFLGTVQFPAACHQIANEELSSHSLSIIRNAVPMKSLRFQIESTYPACQDVIKEISRWIIIIKMYYFRCDSQVPTAAAGCAHSATQR